MKGRLKKRSLLFEVVKLARLPAVFRLIKSGVEGERVNMQVRVGHSAHRPRGQVNKLRPCHVSGDALAVGSAFAHPHRRELFHLPHGLRDR